VIGPWRGWLTIVLLWHCWLGHLTRKIVSEMTYNVSRGTLNPTIAILYNSANSISVQPNVPDLLSKKQLFSFAESCCSTIINNIYAILRTFLAACRQCSNRDLLLVCMSWTITGSATKQRLHLQSVPGSRDKPPFSFVKGQDSTMWDIVCVSPQGHRSVSVSRHFLLQALQCPCSVRKRFNRDHCCRGRSKPSVAALWGHTLGENWPPEPTSSYASVDLRRYIDTDRIHSTMDVVLQSGVELELVESLPLLEWLANNYKSFGATLEIITDKSQEGAQFVRGFGGIGGYYFMWSSLVLLRL